MDTHDPLAQDYGVGWICAVKVEYVIACELLDREYSSPPSISGDENIYTCGVIAGHNVVIACLPKNRYGTSPATSVAKDMLRSFPALNIRLMVGIAGGSPTSTNDVRLGDVVVSAPVGRSGGIIPYDYGKAIQQKRFEWTAVLNAPPNLLLNACQKLDVNHSRFGNHIDEDIKVVISGKPHLENVYQRPAPGSDVLYDSSFLHNDGGQPCHSSCSRSIDRVVQRPSRGFLENHTTVHYGLIASADRLMKDAEIRDCLASTEQVLCFEMEAAGLMDYFNCIVIRGICDYCDTHKNDQWQGYAAAAAAVYARDLLKLLPVEVKSRSDEASQHKIVPTLPDVMRLDKDIIQSLAFSDMHNRRQNIEHAHPDTCKWIFELLEFKLWERQDQGLLWIKGKPGAGKSTLMASLYDHIKEKQRSLPDGMLVDFFFNGRGSRLQRTKKGMFRALLCQLFQKSNEVRGRFRAVYKENNPDHDANQGDVEWEERDLRDLLETTMMKLGQIGQPLLIFVDALDEAGSQEAEIVAKMFINMSKRLAQLSRIKICISCRHYPIMPANNMAEIWVEQHNTHDIKRFIQDELSHEFSSNREQEQWLSIERELLNRAHGVFQWVSLIVPLIAKSSREGDTAEMIQSWLRQVPEELETVYEHILRRVISPSRRIRSLRLFQSVCFSREPLTVSEVRYALSAIEACLLPTRISTEDTPEFARTDEQMARQLKALSGGLIEIVLRPGYTVQRPRLRRSKTESRRGKLPDVGIVQVVHQTVFDYFVETGLQLLSALCRTDTSPKNLSSPSSLDGSQASKDMGHTFLFKSCLSYLSTLNFHTVLQHGAAGDFHDRFPWISYSTRYLFVHGKLADKVIAASGDIERYIQLLEHVMQFWSFLQFKVSGHEKLPDVQHGYKPVILSIYLLTAHNMPHVLRQVLQRNASSIGDRDSEERNALRLAYQNGFEEVANVIVKAITVTESNQQKHAQTLCQAVSNGYTTVVEHLLQKGVDINASNEYTAHRTALEIACESGNESMVQMLLKAGANPNVALPGKHTALMYAVQHGNSKLVSMMLDAGADYTAVYNGYDYNTTVLGLAVRSHRLELVKMLLNAGAGTTIDHVDKSGRTCLTRAAEHGNHEIVSVLLDAGANPDGDAPDSQLFAVARAAANGHGHIVQMLVAAGANMNHRDSYQHTPLSIAMAAGQMETALVLLDLGVDVPGDRDETIARCKAELVEQDRRYRGGIVRWGKRPQRWVDNVSIAPPLQ